MDTAVSPATPRRHWSDIQPSRDASPSKAGLVRYFDRIRVINLSSRGDRRAETEIEFTSMGQAIDGHRCAFFEAIVTETAAGFPGAAVRGCYLSHLAVLEEAWRDGVARVLVLEDDIAFVRDIGEQGKVAVRQLDGLDWDIAYFGHALDNLPGTPTWKRVSRPMRHAHCYAVHGRALKRLIDFLRTVLERPAGHPDGGPMHYDGALSTFLAQNPDIRAFHFSRNLGYQRPSRTDLHVQSIIDRNRLLRPWAGLYRALKRAYMKRTR
jgi:GNAT superfamily N-acetyltransferase